MQGVPTIQEPVPITGTKQAGTLRVGVVAINNKTDRSPSLTVLRSRLIGNITGSNIDAVALDSKGAAEIEAEARQKGCDYILYTDLSLLKTSGKAGGLIGKATGVGALKERVESRLDFKLYPLGTQLPQLSSSASARQEGTEDESLAAAATQEAKLVVDAVRKR
jgi:hypothetical protein